MERDGPHVDHKYNAGVPNVAVRMLLAIALLVLRGTLNLLLSVELADAMDPVNTGTPREQYYSVPHAVGVYLHLTNGPWPN